jgi:hypothetical protein
MVSIDKARYFVHAHGTMWERALWDYLFDGGSLDRVHQCLLCYKNADGGWGHGLEHDLKSPLSNPLMLEFLLTVGRDTGVPLTAVLDGTPQWVENVQREDGLLEPPTGLLDYPHAPWWEQMQMGAPDSITGHLTKLGLCPPVVQERTRQWVTENVGLEQIRANDWLFMAYHAFDYYMNVDDFPKVETYREAVLENLYACALAHEEAGDLHKLFPLFQFAQGPESVVAQHAPAGLIDRILNHLQSTQRDDGGWDDEHGLAYWQPYFSTVVLLALQRFGRLE